MDRTVSSRGFRDLLFDAVLVESVGVCEVVVGDRFRQEVWSQETTVPEVVVVVGPLMSEGWVEDEDGLVDVGKLWVNMLYSSSPPRLPPYNKRQVVRTVLWFRFCRVGVCLKGSSSKDGNEKIKLFTGLTYRRFAMKCI